MAIYHVNEAGEARICRAFIKSCPLGGPEDHFLNKQDALQGYELKQLGSFEQEHRDKLILIDEQELRLIDARLLAKAKELSEAQSLADIDEIAAVTEPLAIIAEARVERIIEMSS